MLQNKLQIHPENSKYMFIGSAYNIKHKVSGNPILVNNVPIPWTENYNCIGVNIDEKFTWEKRIDMICPETLKLIYNAIVQPYFDSAASPETTVE
jgi:hypothetical protein